MAAAAANDEAAADSLTRVRERLERISEPFAARRMQRALSAGMAGKSLEEIESALAAEEGLDARRGGHSAALIQDDEHGE
jgi:molecular chaperone HscA